MPRWLEALLPWGLLCALLVTLQRCLLAPRWAAQTLEVAGLPGMLLLAIPAIRVNEQGRLIERVRELRIPAHADHPFQGKLNTCSSRSRSLIPVHADHGSGERR